MVLCAVWSVSAVFGQDSDYAMREFLGPEMRQDLEPLLFGDSRYFTAGTGKQSPFSLALDVQQRGLFRSFQDTVLAIRPNLAQLSLGFRETPDTRTTIVSAFLSCYAERRERSPFEFRTEDWRKQPRPVAFIMEKESSPQQVVFRTWPSPSESEGANETDLSWCLSPTGTGEEFGVQKTFEIHTKLPRGDPAFAPLAERLGAIGDNPQRVVPVFREEFEQSLERHWGSPASRSVFFSLRQLGVNLTSVSEETDVRDFSKAESDLRGHDLFGKLQSAVAIGQDRASKIDAVGDLPDQLATQQEPRTSSTEVVLAICSALGGTIVEDVLLMVVLEGRRMYGTKGLTERDRSFLALFLRYVLLLALAALDLLPLVFLVIEERARRSWSSNGIRIFVRTEHATGSSLGGTREHPTGHGIMLALSTWRTVGVQDSRFAIVSALLAIAILVHAIVLGHRAFGAAIRTMFPKATVSLEQTKPRNRRWNPRKQERDHPANWETNH